MKTMNGFGKKFVNFIYEIHKQINVTIEKY